MIIIFTDVPGVLSTEKDGTLDKDLISNLNKLVLQHGAKIVLTTSWEEQSDFFATGRLLYDNGLVQESILSALPKGMDKMYGIMTWLQIHESHVKNFVIIDSGLNKMRTTPMKKKFVQTKKDIGLDQIILDKANQKLAS